MGILLGSRSGATLEGGSWRGSDAEHSPSDGEHKPLELADDSRPLDTDSRGFVSDPTGSYDGASWGESGDRFIAADCPRWLEFVSLRVLVSTEDGVVAAPDVSVGSSLNSLSGVSIIIVESIRSADAVLWPRPPSVTAASVGAIVSCIDTDGCTEGSGVETICGIGMVRSDAPLSRETFFGVLRSSSAGSAVERNVSFGAESATGESTGSFSVNPLVVSHGITSLPPARVPGHEELVDESTGCINGDVVAKWGG